jgi:hypothetical protein
LFYSNKTNFKSESTRPTANSLYICKIEVSKACLLNSTHAIQLDIFQYLAMYNLTPYHENI